MTPGRLMDIAYVRSGDKGDTVTIGVIAKAPAYVEPMLSALDVERIRELYGSWVVGDIEVHPMRNIGAAMVLLRGGLGGGAASTLRLDQTGKALGGAILRLPLP